MNPFLKTVLTFVLYYPSPVIIMDDLCLRGVVTTHTGESIYALVFKESSLTYTLSKPTNLIVDIKKDKIKLNVANLVDEDSSKGGGTFEILKSENLDYLRKIKHQKYDQDISLHSDSISDEKIVSLEAEMAMNLQSVVLNSPIVALFAKKYVFNNSSCKARTLIIGSQDKNSLYDSIEIIFDEQIEAYAKIFGELDFEVDSHDFAVFGVKTIKINFSENAFSSHGKPILNIKSGEELF